MTPGFLVEHVRMPATPEAQMWVAGKSSRGLFGLKGPLIAYEVQSFRCVRCGMLESYVPRVRREGVPRGRSRSTGQRSRS
jgi:hypothetical protein